MNRTAWIIIAIVVVAGLGGLVFMTKKDQVNVDALDPAAVLQPTDTTLGDNVYGKTDAKIVLIEYGDFQCGGCAAANINVIKIKQTYREKIAFVFRNFPLTSSHPNALASATVAEAAGLQGKYWEMNGLLYANQDSWSSLSAEKRGAMFESYATQLGLNLEQYRNDLTSAKIQQKISTDRALGNRSGVNETPSFFIGAEKVDSTTASDVIQQDGTKLMDKLDAALKAVGETPPTR